MSTESTRNREARKRSLHTRGSRKSDAEAAHVSGGRAKVSVILKRFASAYYEQLKKIRDGPRAVAGGAAIGIFWAFTPLLGLKTLLAILFTWVFRCSKVSAALAVSIHDILTPFWPFFLRWEYDFGFWILSHPHHFPNRLGMADAHLRFWLHWSTLEILWPSLVGSLLFGVPSALISYLIVERLLQRYEGGHRDQFTPPA
jgi:uncharacterized protein (DUF2062 family)